MRGTSVGCAWARAGAAWTHWRRGGLRVVEQAREVIEDAGRALLGVPTGVRDDQQEAARAGEGALRMQQAGERVEVRGDGVGGLAQRKELFERRVGICVVATLQALREELDLRVLAVGFLGFSPRCSCA